MGIEITRRQTTFWEFQTPASENVRMHFHHKEEYRFVGGPVSRLSIVEKHPILIDYENPWDDLYLASATMDFHRICTELEKVIEAESSGWRAAKFYLNGDPRVRLYEGFGLLGPGLITSMR